jgi:hypothetical protein
MGVGGVASIPGKPPGFCDFIARGPFGDHAGESGMQGLSGRQITGLGRRDLPGHAWVKLHVAGRMWSAHASFALSAENLPKDGLVGPISGCMARSAVGAKRSHSTIPLKMGLTRVDILNLVLSKFE